MVNREKSRSEPIYREVRERISLLQYSPGTPLSENALAQEFDVSRTSVRRALRRLEFERLVVSKRGVGTMVTSIDIRSLKEVYALRIKLRELIGELCPVVRVTDDDIAALENLVRETEALRDQRDPEALARVYNAFEEEMLRHVTNDPLRRISEQLYYQTSRVWLQILPDLDWEEEVDIMAEEIADTLEALRSGDMETAAQVRRDHLVMMLGRVQNYLGGGVTTTVQ